MNTVSRSEVMEGRRLDMPRWLLLRGCEAIWCAYFLSLWAYKTWYIATAAVFGVAAVLGALRWLRVRGIVQAAFPVAAYFIYLYASGTRSEFPDNAHWWAVADSIMIAIVAVFWLLLRNVPADLVSDLFIRMAILGALFGLVLLLFYPWESRAGGYALDFNPFAIP